MNASRQWRWVLGTALLMIGVTQSGCRNWMPHSVTWPATGSTIPTHPKPPGEGYYKNWDPYAVTIELEPVKDVNPVRTQHILIATVRDKDGEPLPNRRVEWIISKGSVGDIVEVDESGWRASRGYKMDNSFAVSHTNNFHRVLDRGNDDPSDDIHLEPGQTWCVITSPIEGETHIVAYAPGIYAWDSHKAFAVKHWYDVAWEWPVAGTNPTGTSHQFVTRVMKHSDGSPLVGYEVNYRITDGPAGSFEPGGGTTASVKTDSQGLATVTLNQARPEAGTNEIAVEIIRPEDVQCCEPAVHIASGSTWKTWIAPQIGIQKSAPATAMVNDTFTYDIVVSSLAEVPANNVVVTDTLPDGIEYVSSRPEARVNGQALTWSLGTMAAGAQSSLAVQVRATRTGRFDNCADVTADQGLAARDCAEAVVTAPALSLEKRCPAEVVLCDSIPYTLVVRNTGDGPATNVRISDPLPDGLRTEGGERSISVNVGDLAAGQSREFTFSLKADQPGRYENTATATADRGLTAEASCVTVVRLPVLVVSKTGPEQQFIGRPVAFEITVTNTGDTPARETVLTDPIPSGAEFIDATDGGRFADGRVTWDLGTLEPNASRTVTIRLRSAERGVIRNTATARAYCAEASDDASTTIRGIAALLLRVVDDPDPIEVGATTTYTIEVTNQGTADDTGIVIVCELPPEQDLVSAEGPTRATVDERTIRFAPVPVLEPRQMVVYRIEVRANAAGDVRFRTVLTSDMAVVPIEETESTHQY